MKVFELIEKLNELTDEQKQMEIASEDYEAGIVEIEEIQIRENYSSRKKEGVVVLR